MLSALTSVASALAQAAGSPFDGDIVIGGRFDTAGGAPAAHIAAWNGGDWEILGSGSPPHRRTTVSSLLVGGDFTTAGTFTSIRLGEWAEPAAIAAGAVPDGDEAPAGPCGPRCERAGS